MSVESSSTGKSSTAEALLREIGQTSASGVLELRHSPEVVSHVWVRGGRIYAMQVPGYRPALGIRLLSGGLVSPEQLSRAAAEQRERRPGQLIGEVLVGMGFVGAEVIDAFVREQVIDQLADLFDLEVGAVDFHQGRHIRQGISQPAAVDELLVAAHGCRARRADVLARVGGPSAVPVLGPPLSGPTQTPLGPYDWALLCRVDGTRDITELARVCGFTVVEAAQLVADLAVTGLLALPAPERTEEPELAPVVALHPHSEPPDPQWRFDGTDAGEPDPVQVPPSSHEPPEVSRELLAEFGALHRDDPRPVEPPEVRRGREDGPLPGRAASGRTKPPAWGPRGGPPPQDQSVPGPGTQDPAPTVEPATLAMVPPPTTDPELSLVPAQAPRSLSVVGNSPRPSLAPVGPEPNPTDPSSGDGAVEPGASQPDTTAFMRELSSLSDDPESEETVVTRLVVPLTEHRRKRRPWSR